MLTKTSKKNKSWRTKLLRVGVRVFAQKGGVELFSQKNNEYVIFVAKSITYINEKMGKREKKTRKERCR